MNVRQVNDAFESTRRVGSRCGKYVTEREPRVADEELKEIGNRTNGARCVQSIKKEKKKSPSLPGQRAGRPFGSSMI